MLFDILYWLSRGLNWYFEFWTPDTFIEAVLAYMPVAFLVIAFTWDRVYRYLRNKRLDELSKIEAKMALGRRINRRI